MKNTLLKSLLKAKTAQTDEIEVLIEKYLRDVTKTNKQQSAAFVSELLVYIMQNVENLNKEVLLSVVESKLSHLSYSVETAALEEIHTKAAAAVASSVGATFSFDKTDAEVLDSMYRALTWMKDDAAANSSGKLKSIIADAMKGEVTMAKLGETLRQGFEGVVDESARYFEGVSDHIIRQSQSVTRAYQFEKAGVKEVKVVAVMDGKTSQICKSMDGRIIPIRTVVKQADGILKAQSIAEKKNVSEWQSQPIFSRVLPDKVALPPYHFRCRTIVVAFFRQETDINGKNANGSLLPGEIYRGKKVRFSHVDRFGYERVVTEKTNNHGGNGHPDMTDNKILKAINGMDRLASHGSFADRTVGLNKDKQVFFSFKGAEVWTAFKQNRKDYFDDQKVGPVELLDANTKKGADNASM